MKSVKVKTPIGEVLMTIKEIIEKHLKDNGFDGLHDGDECGCLIGHLAPCGCMRLGCMPGYNIGGDEYNTFCIKPEKIK